MAKSVRPGAWLGVRGKLVILVMALLVPVAVLDAIGVYIRYERQVQQELEQSHALAEAISAGLVNYAESLWDAELAIGNTFVLEGWEHSPDGMEAVMRGQLTELPTVSAMSFIDAQGITVATTFETGRGTSVSDRDHFLRILAGEEKVVSDLVVGRISTQPTVIVARAVRRNGRLLGVVSASIDVTKLADVLPAPPTGGRRFVLLDRSGQMVYCSDQPGLPMDQRLTGPENPARRSLAGETVLARRFHGEDGTLLMGVSVPIGRLGWAFFSSVPRGAVMADTNRHVARDMVVLVIASSASLLLALYLGRSILRPIEALQRAARAMSAGDLQARISLTGTDELAAAAQTFDSMAARVQLSDEVLKARMTAVARLSQQALGGADISALSDAAAALVALSLGTEAAMVLELLPFSRQVRIRAAVGLPDGAVGQVIRTGYDILAEHALDQSEPQVIPDIQALLGAQTPRLGDERIVTGVAAPIVEGEQPFGVLFACSTYPRHFHPSDLHFLQAVGNVVATAIGRKRTEEEQVFLARTGAVLAASLDAEATLAGVAELATEFLADWCIVDVQAGSRRTLCVRSSRPELAETARTFERFVAASPPSYQAAGDQVSTGESIVRFMITDETLRAAGTDETALELLRSMQIVSSVAFPLVARGRTLGLMSFMRSGSGRGYDSRDAELCEELARRAALAVDHADMYGEATAALAARDRALAEAEAERQRLHSLFEQVPALIQILHGPEHIVTMANRQYRRLRCGRNLIGRPKFEGMPELLGQGFKQLLDEVYATGQPYVGMEVRAMVDRQGTGLLEEGFYSFVYEPIRDAAGQVEGILVHATDVTEQVRARRQVEALAADLRTLARQQAAVAVLGQRLIGGAAMPAVLSEASDLVEKVLGIDSCQIMEVTPDGRHLQLRAGVPWLGYERIAIEPEPGVYTLAGYTLHQRQPVIIEDLRRETRFSIWAKLLELGVVSGLSVVIEGEKEPFGTVTAVTVAHRVFTQDDVNFLMAVAHAISRGMQHLQDQRRLSTQHAITRILADATEAAAAGQQILQAICECLQWDVGLFWYAEDGEELLRCGHAWQAPGIGAEWFLQLNRGYAVGPGQGLIGEAWQKAAPVWVPDVLAEPSFRRAPGAATVGLHGGLWIPVLLGDTALGVIECFSREVRRPDPATISMAATLGSQIGQFLQRQRAEADLRRLNAELEERVATRTSELEAANRELESFAYSVSHDLRAPLRTIDGFSQALVEDCGDAVGAEGTDYIRRIRAACRNMSGLIDDLLRLSRVMRQEIRKEQVNLTLLARSVLADLERDRPDHKVCVTVADGLRAHGDERLLRLVLQNLLANAWKFTSRRAQPEISVGAEEQDGKTVFFVKDNGAGFDMAYADRLFAPFQRLHLSTEFEGTGIGLATVQRVIQRHGGRVWAEGKVDQGATFYFTL
ncbi:MAG TPA: GAF domain-containing protein [Symbiobacteriaceae bacterium]|nr:GAF domain-containing protein [Symbiobacteriaceae bacterium]